jgi:2,3-bisphosphoglycerate-independent phosphoglycerate mutase
MNLQYKNKVMLIIMDGLGAAHKSRGNAVSLAKPDNLIRYWDTYPHTYLRASGEAVGLPPGVYGNSEVGHLNLGAGKVILQNLPKINKAIEKGSYFANTSLLKLFNHCVQYNSDVHLIGCMSDGKVHSHIDHFIATLKFFSQKNFPNKIYIHAFTDGRDTGPKSATTYLKNLEIKGIEQFKIGHIASICGRAFAMDRNNKWERTEKAYKLLTNGTGTSFKTWNDALNTAYLQGQIDEYIEPCIISDGETLPVVKENDAVIYMNYRSDRAIQLTEAFIDKEFDKFPRLNYQNLHFVSMVPYKKDFPEHNIMPKEYINLSLGRLVSEYGYRQLRIAESEKFPHVTYFFNGGVAVKYHGEDRIEIPSPNVTTYDKQPEMSALILNQVLNERIDLGIYDLIVLNLANTDMVGHTGNLEACIKSVQVVDHVVHNLTQRFAAKGGTVIITSDHGNVEEVIKLDTGEKDTEHSANPVPFIVVNPNLPKRLLNIGSLSDVAPTILDLMGIPKPNEMIGRSLIE